MKILLIAPELPYPPRKGGAIRNFHILRGLAERHEVTVLACARTRQELDDAAPLAVYGVDVETAPVRVRTKAQRIQTILSSGLPDLALRFDPGAVARRIRLVMGQRRFDVVQVEGLEMSLAWLLAQDGIRRGGQMRPQSPIGPAEQPITALDELNAEFLLQKRAFATDVRDPARWIRAGYSLVQWRRLQVFEADACSTFDRVIAVSEADRQALLGVGHCPNVAVVPNGVDTTYFSPAGLTSAWYDPDRPVHGGRRDVPAVVFTGTMDFRPNVDAVRWFCRNVLGRIRAQHPATQFFIVGQKPNDEVAKLGRLPGVVVTGAVEDVRPYIQGSAAYVVPMRMGGGIRLKVLEAMSMGKAVVSTTFGADGIDVIDGEHLLLADDPEAFAAAVLRVMTSEDLRTRIGAAARELVTDRYDWRVLVPRLETVYEQAAEEKGKRWVTR